MTVHKPRLRIRLGAISALLVGLAALATAAHAQSEMVIVKEGTKLYHRAGCPVIRDGKGVIAMTRAQAESRSYTAHPDCDPALHPPTDDKSQGADAPRPEPPQYVYVDAAGKYYHRQDCKRLGAAPRKLVLDEAGRKYWPCPTCRPPIRKRPNR